MNFPRRPLGLVLLGGGAHGAWQAGCLKRLCRDLAFERVLGFSIGALNGLAAAFGRLELLELWREIERVRALRPALRLKPLSLFSHEGMRSVLAPFSDEARARKELRCPLTVVSLCVEEQKPFYARFEPAGAWEGSLSDHLAATCSIPLVFPPVRVSSRGGPRTLVDGGIPGREWMEFGELRDCADVVLLHMTASEDARHRALSPWSRLDQDARAYLIECARRGSRVLLGGGGRRVFHVGPSRRLDYFMLSFKNRPCREAMERGELDAAAFLSDPGAFRHGDAHGRP